MIDEQSHRVDMTTPYTAQPSGLAMRPSGFEATTQFIWIYWMFYDHLSAHSPLAKLCRWWWLIRMRLAWEKSQNTLDTSKRLHRNKTRSTGCGLGKVQVRHAWMHIVIISQARYLWTTGPAKIWRMKILYCEIYYFPITFYSTYINAWCIWLKSNFQLMGYIAE